MLYRIYLSLIGALLLAAPLAVGAVHTEVVVGLGITVTVAWVVQGLVFGEKDRSRTVISVPSLAFWLFALVSVLQIVPLPQSVVEALSPTRWAHYQAGWQVLFPGRPIPDTWTPLSLDPEQTADRALRWLTLGMTALLAANHARIRHAWRDTLRVVTTSGLIVLAVGALQVISGADEVLFLYEPQASIRDYTTFINSNHAAVFFGLTSLCGFALALRSFKHHIVEAIFATIAGIVLMIAMAEQDSVGATSGFGLGVLALIGFFMQNHRARRLLSRHRARLLSVICFGLPLVAPIVAFTSLQLGPSWVTEQVSSTDLGRWIDEEGGTRLELMSAAVDGSFDYRAIGAGAGAIERVISPYLDWSQLPLGVVPTIENEPVQWLLEFGWPVGVAALLLLTLHFWFGLRAHLAESRLRYGVGLALGIFLAFNAQFHFLFFTLGVAVPAIFVLESAIAWKTRDEESHPKFGCCSTDREYVRWAVAAVSGAAMACCFGAYAHSAIGSGELFGEEQMGDELERISRLVPSEGELYAWATRLSEREARLIELAKHAVELEPTAQMKLFLAGKLWGAGERDGAITVYRDVFSEAYPRMRSAWISKYLVQVVRDPEAIASGLRQGDADQWRVAARAIRRHIGEREEILFATALVEQQPKEYEPYRLLIRSYLYSKKYALADLWSRLLILRAVESADGEMPAGIALLVESLRRQGKRTEARDLVLEYVDRIERDDSLGVKLMRLRSEYPQRASALEAEAISRFRSSYCAKPLRRQQRLWCWVAEGWLSERDGELGDAQFAYERVQRKLDDPDFLGAFLARHGKCIELNKLIAQLERSEGRVGRLKRMTDDCAAERNAH